MLIPEFKYNNVKILSKSYTLLEFNYKYYLCIFFKIKKNLYSKSELVN